MQLKSRDSCSQSVWTLEHGRNGYKITVNFQRHAGLLANSIYSLKLHWAFSKTPQDGQKVKNKRDIVF